MTTPLANLHRQNTRSTAFFGLLTLICRLETAGAHAWFAEEALDTRENTLVVQ